MIGDRNCIPFRAFLVAKQRNTLINRQYLPFFNIFVSDFSFLTFFRYYHHIAQHYSQVQEYKVFVTTISADVFFFLCLTFLNEMVSVLVLSLLKSILSREGTHGLPLRCTLKPTCTKPLTRYLSVNVFSFFIFF